MKIPVCALIVVVLGVLPTGAQQRQGPVISPEIKADRTVTFRVRVPDAKLVELTCEGLTATNAGQSTVPMEKDERGVWSFTTGPMEPDIYEYTFTVDGLKIVDPNNSLLKYNLQNYGSLLHVKGTNALPWEAREVPHGELHRHFYKSAVAADDRDYVVYTPPGYDPTARKRYPVLYLLHGYSDDATAWSTVGCANVILDNLIAGGRAKPMLVVMPLGYGDMNVVKPGGGGLRARGLLQTSMDKFGDALLKEVMPQVEKTYRVAADRNNRAIAGLSMGGTESLLTGLNNADKFAWVGSFSAGGLPMTNTFARAFSAADTNLNNQLRLLWIGCGSGDNLRTANIGLRDWLATRGVESRWVEIPGVHSFRVWRRNLADFAPLLFQEKPKERAETSRERPRVAAQP